MSRLYRYIISLKGSVLRVTGNADCNKTGKFADFREQSLISRRNIGQREKPE